MSRLHEHKTGKVKEEERIKKLKENATKDMKISDLVLAMLDK